jgi:benzoyl-CoA reductase subunit B
VLQSAKNKPSPIDAYFGGIYYIGPIFGAFRGTDDAIEYYRSCARSRGALAPARAR